MGSIRLLLQRCLQVFMQLQALMSCQILLSLSCIYLQTVNKSAATLLEATHVLVLVDMNWPLMENLVQVNILTLTFHYNPEIISARNIKSF